MVIFETHVQWIIGIVIIQVVQSGFRSFLYDVIVPLLLVLFLQVLCLYCCPLLSGKVQSGLLPFYFTLDTVPIHLVVQPNGKQILFSSHQHRLQRCWELGGRTGLPVELIPFFLVGFTSKSWEFNRNTPQRVKKGTRKWNQNVWKHQHQKQLDTKKD